MLQSRTNNLVGPKPIVIPLTLEVNQKKAGWHPWTPCVTERRKNADNARLRVGLFVDEITGDWRDTYHCVGVLAEGYDNVASHHPFAGNKIGCLMMGSSDASRIQNSTTKVNNEMFQVEIDNSWAMMEDVVADLDDIAVNVGGKDFRYFGFRRARANDKPRDIVGKTLTGKSPGDRTVPIQINVSL